jgi:hypothetical protein
MIVLMFIAILVMMDQSAFAPNRHLLQHGKISSFTLEMPMASSIERFGPDFISADRPAHKAWPSFVSAKTLSSVIASSSARQSMMMTQVHPVQHVILNMTVVIMHRVHQVKLVDGELSAELLRDVWKVVVVAAVIALDDGDSTNKAVHFVFSKSSPSTCALCPRVAVAECIERSECKATIASSKSWIWCPKYRIGTISQSPVYHDRPW